MNTENPIVLYTAPDGSTQIDVKLENETVWLTQQQMAILFDVTPQNITIHIKSIYQSEELEKVATCKDFLQVRKEGSRNVSRVQKFYNLDMILSVGYRVNSKRAVSFRRWATSVLKDYLIKGFAVDKRRLEHYNELKDVVKLMSRAVALQYSLSNDEFGGLIKVIGDYVYALDTLDKYDYQRLEVEKITKNEPFRATYENAIEAIQSLKDKFGGSALFANEKDDSFKSSIGQIYQTFGGEDLYQSVEEKAAMLLYLVVKNHSFSDGNKRIGAMLFLWFLSKNGILYATDGHKRIADNTLVAITILIAESRSDEKDIMVKLVVNLINQDNQ